MNYIDPNRPPSRIRNRPADFIVGVITETVRRDDIGRPILRQRAVFVHVADLGARVGETLTQPAFVEREGMARGVLALADAAERREIARWRDAQCRAAWANDRAGWGIPL